MKRKRYTEGQIINRRFSNSREKSVHMAGFFWWQGILVRGCTPPVVAQHGLVGVASSPRTNRKIKLPRLLKPRPLMNSCPVFL